MTTAELERFELAFEQALKHAVEVFDSMAHKVVDRNPGWDEIPFLLTGEEQLVFWAVLNWSVPKRVEA